MRREPRVAEMVRAHVYPAVAWGPTLFILAVAASSACVGGTPGAPGGACGAADACEAGYLCVRDVCTKLCISADDCLTTGEVCREGVCTGCTAQADCGGSLACLPTGLCEQPRAVGASCLVGADCDSVHCSCTDTACALSAQVCTATACDPCTAASPDGACTETPLVGGVKVADVCDGASSCYADGCKLDLGADCSTGDDGACESGNCECATPDCQSRVCAAADCLCTVYDPIARVCTSSLLADAVEDPGDCDGSHKCVAGVCRDACTTPADCVGSLACLTSGVCEQPRGAGDVCAVGLDCASSLCACGDATCSADAKVCSRTPCAPCTYADASGSCTSTPLADGVKVVGVCDGASSCYADGCKLDLGADCSTGDDGACESSNCECATPDCQSRVCAAADCLCTTYDPIARVCTSTPLADAVEDPGDCDGSHKCVAGVCRAACSTQADCVGSLACLTLGVCELPRGVGDACELWLDCASSICACGDATCSAGAKVCSLTPCEPCTYADANGSCTAAPLADGVKVAGVCDGASSCYSDGCKLDAGADCSAATDAACETGSCECTTGDCTGRVCAAVDCICTTYDALTTACEATPLDDAVQDPGDCDDTTACFTGTCRTLCDPLLQASESRACGNCGSGTQERVCDADGWWHDWGVCTGDGCVPGAEQACGTWGSQTCLNDCTWGACTLRITASTSNYNLAAALGAPTTPVSLTVVVGAGVTISSAGPANPAFTTGALPAGSSVLLVNEGAIIGAGGGGGTGGYWVFAGGVSSTAGGPGGTALALGVDVTIDNTSGFIGGGGGGGAGGGCNLMTANGGGGGGGAGSIGGPGGTSPPNVAGSPGTAGTTTGGGGGVGGTSVLGSVGGTGGAGGNYGQPGAPGATPNAPLCATGAGGAAGRAVKLNGHSVTWLGGNDASRVQGPVS